MDGWTGRLAARASLLVACLATVACGSAPPTELVVVVDGSEAARAAIGCLVLEAGPEPADESVPFTAGDVREVPLGAGVPDRTMPVSFGLAPSAEGPRARVRLRVSGYAQCPSVAAGAAPLTWRMARTWFVPGETRLLSVLLELPGEGATCAPACFATGSCAALGCVPIDEVDPAALPPVAPGREFDDAGMRMDASIDAGGEDAGGVDAGADDAGYDAGEDAGYDGGAEDAGSDAGYDAGTPQTFDAVVEGPTGIALLGIDGESAIVATRNDANVYALDVRDPSLTARAGTSRSLVTPARGDTSARPVAAIVRTSGTGRRLLACGDVGADGLRFGPGATDLGARIVAAPSGAVGTRAWLAEFDLATGAPTFAMVVALADADVSCADLSVRLDRDGQSAVLALVGARRGATATSTLWTTTLLPGVSDALVTSTATAIPGLSGTGVPPARFGLVLDVKPPIEVWTAADVLRRGLALNHAARLRVAPTYDGSGAIYVAASGASTPTGLGVPETGAPGAVLARLGPSASTPSVTFTSSWAVPFSVAGTAGAPVVTGLASAPGGAALSVDVEGPAMPGASRAYLSVDGMSYVVEDPKTAAILLVEATTGAPPAWALRRLVGPASLAVRVTGTKQELPTSELKALVAGATPLGTRAIDDGGWTLPSAGEDTDFTLVGFYGSWASGAASFGLHGAVFTMSSDAAGLDVITNARLQSRDSGAAGSPGLFVAGTPATGGRVTFPWTAGGSITTSAGAPFLGFLYLR